MKMESKKIRIGELAQSLAVERFVIRFWEKEFDISCERSEGGQRFYTSKDAEKFHLIKELLYDKGFTIAGAKKHFSSAGSAESKEFKNNHMFAASKDASAHEAPQPVLNKDLTNQIRDLQKKLLKLRELL